MATGEILFNLAFRAKAVIPIEIKIPLTKFMIYDEQENTDHLRMSLDLLKEIRKRAQIRMVSYQQ